MDEARALHAEVSRDIAHDVSAPLRRLANRYKATQQSIPRVIKEGGGPRVASDGFSGDAARQRRAGTAQIAAPTSNFEGISNQDNVAVYGFGVNPPDPDGDVGPNHYVEIVNLLFAVYSKSGAELLGPRRSARCGTASRSTTARSPPATRSCCTISWPTGGS